MTKNDSIRLCAVGDCGALNKAPETAFDYVGEVLRKADITFGQNERHYHDNWENLKPTGAYFSELTHTRNAQALKQGGFDVISFASNHTMDLGEEVALHTVSVLEGLGFSVVGIGKSLAEARKPAILERKGSKVGFLAYCSVGRLGSNATAYRAGIAPMRAHTSYEQTDYQPGTPPTIITWPYADDLEAVLEDVKNTRPQVDVLAVSFHWGIHLTRAVLADYQRIVGHAVIDAGADIILGHHPHVLKGIEIYKGKPIIHSMGQFALDPCLQMTEYRKMYADIDHYRQHYGDVLNLEDIKKTMIVQADISKGRITRLSFRPVLINGKFQPVLLRNGDSDFNMVFEYMKDICEEAGLDTKFQVEGNEIAIVI